MHALPCLVVSLFPFARRGLGGYVWFRIVVFSLDVPVVFPSHVPPLDVVIGRTPTLRSIWLMFALTETCLRGNATLSHRATWTAGPTCLLT